MGPAHTYLAPEDPLANRHMQNWRQLAFQKMNFSHDENFFYLNVGRQDNIWRPRRLLRLRVHF